MNKQPKPPKQALRFLRWFCREDYLEEIEGNLLELYKQQLEVSSQRARWQFFWNVLRHFRPAFIRSFRIYQPVYHRAMLRHNFLITLRSFMRHKTSFLINLTGLSTGLACVILVYLWVSDELSINKFHEKDSQLYQVLSNLEFSQNILTNELTPVPLATALAEEMPEVEYAVAVNDFFSWRTREGILSTGDTRIAAEGWHAGKDFFQVFSYELVEGDKNRALSDKNNILLSEELAEKLFGTTDDLMGTPIEWKHPLFEGVFQIAGIFKLPQASSTAQFDFLFSIEVLLDNDPWAKEWGGYAETYLILEKGIDISQFNEKIADFIKIKDPSNSNWAIFAQQYSDKYLYGQYENGMPVGGRIAYVRLFTLVAFVILLIACVNFMNLSTAKASLKMKEIGVKKTIGASRGALVAQFLGESLLTAFLSLVVAFLLVMLLLPQFSEIAGKHLHLNLGIRDTFIIAGIVLFTGFLAGSYPAFYLSNFKPIAVLKGKLHTSTGALWIRQGLVVFQFTLSVLFIVGLLVINAQIKFTQTENLGYNRDNIITFPWKGELYDGRGLREGKSNERFETFMAEMKNIPGVVSATHMSGNILSEIYGQSGISWSSKESDREFLFKSPIVGYDFIKTLEIELLEGRAFSRDYNDDYSKIILNEAAVQLMELENPVGEIIQMNGGSEIIGVVKNFHYGSLHNPIEPLIFRFDPTGRNVMVKIKAGTERNTIAQLKKLQSEFSPGNTFEFTFLDEDYQALYEAEDKVATLSNYLAVIAMIISCLGLFGLTTFTAERRLKEISIRKILGAGDFGIVVLLSTNFTKMVLIAIVIALPLSYVISQRWLESFAARIDLAWWFFIGAGLATLLIAWLTVGIQTVKAAQVNPVDTLRNE
ncbi:MAG: ABC transporter permease [Bacteroidota bacterium]